MLNIKAIIIIVVYSIACFLLSFGFVQCSEKKAQQQINEAEKEKEQAMNDLASAYSENEKLRAVLSKSNEVTEKVVETIKEEQLNHEQRIEDITSDEDANDWLTCELPDVVRDAFKDYCEN